MSDSPKQQHNEIAGSSSSSSELKLALLKREYLKLRKQAVQMRQLMLQQREQMLLQQQRMSQLELVNRQQQRLIVSLRGQVQVERELGEEAAVLSAAASVSAAQAASVNAADLDEQSAEFSALLDPFDAMDIGYSISEVDANAAETAANGEAGTAVPSENTVAQSQPTDWVDRALDKALALRKQQQDRPSAKHDALLRNHVRQNESEKVLKLLQQQQQHNSTLR